MPTDPTKAHAELDRAEREIRSAGRAATADRDRLALRVRAEPANNILAEDLAALEAELAGYRRDLERIAASRRALQEQAEADTLHRRDVSLAAAKHAVLAAGAERLKVGAAVEKALAALGDALAAETAAIERACVAAGNAAAVLFGDDTARGAAVTTVRDLLAGVSPVLGKLQAVMVGHAMSSYVAVVGLSTPQPGIRASADQGFQRLQALVESWSLAKPEPTSTPTNEFADVGALQ